MSEVNPPLYLEAGEHASNLDRLFHSDLLTAGIIASGHLEVAEQSTPALGVTVAAGRAFVEGDEASDQGVYYVSNDAAHDVALATADATNDRIDLIVARVLDSFYSGASDEWEIQAITGTPAASPTAPSAPSNSLILAEVTVPADAGGNPAITNSEITDERVQARSGGVAPGGLLGYAEATSNQLGIGGTPEDLTGLTLTIPQTANRRLRITGAANVNKNTEGRVTLEIMREIDGGGFNLIQRVLRDHVPDGHQRSGEGSVVVDSSGSSNVFKLRMFTGVGTVDLFAGSGFPAFISVEDVGPA